MPSQGLVAWLPLVALTLSVQEEGEWTGECTYLDPGHTVVVRRTGAAVAGIGKATVRVVEL